MKRLYLDYAASAPLLPQAEAVIHDFVQDRPLGNPSSLHREGRSMQARLDRAHTTIASILGVRPTEVVFTSGATESNNLAIRGVLAAWRATHAERPHVVLSSIEHPSWTQAVKAEDVEITFVPVSNEGVVSAPAFLQALRPNTALVGCMYVNNEIGTIQPVPAIGKGIAARREKSDSPFPIFHVDAVQAFPYSNTHSGHLHADTITFSGHKYGALGGIGVLVVRKGTPLKSQLRGGGQEWGIRAGTENVLGASVLAAAMEWHDSHRASSLKHVQQLQEILEHSLARILPSIRIIGNKVLRTPHITYLWLPEVIDEHIVHKLDLAGAAVSSGSACSSGAALPSSTLLALGYDEHEAFGGLRVSYGVETTIAEIDAFVGLLAKVLG